MAKDLYELKWVEELLPAGDYRRKSMFGGFAYYLDERMILLMFESPGSKSYQGKTYGFELWQGCMFPVEHHLQDKIKKKFPLLFSHPVLAKWLYLPLETEGFEELVTDVVKQILKPQSEWGTYPAKKSKKKKEEPISTRIDTRKPRMFSDEPAEEKMRQAKKISDLKNLGAVAEKEFLKAGIKTPQKFIELGWQKTLVKLVKLNSKNRHSIFAYALIGALQNKEWTQIPESDKQTAREFVRSLPRPPKKK